MNPLRILTQLDVICCLFANSFSFGLFTVVQAVTSTLYQQNYPFLDQTDVGLCYLPFGVGAMVGVTCAG